MGLKRAKLCNLLFAVLIHGVIVTSQNITEPTSNPGGELSVQSFLETTTTSSSESTRATTTSEEKTTPSKEAVAVEATKTTTTTAKTTTTTTEEENTTTTTAILVREIASSPLVSYKTDSFIDHTLAPEPMPKPTVTSHPAMTSSPVIEKTMSSPQVKAAPLSSTAKPIVMSHSFVTSSKPVMIDDVITEDGMTSSSSRKEITSTEALNIDPTPVLEKQETSSSPAAVPELLEQTSSSSSSKQIWFSQFEEKMMSSQDLELVTSSQIVSKTISQVEEKMTSSKDLETVMLAMIVMSSAAEEEMTSLQAAEGTVTSTHEDVSSPTNTLAAIPMTSSSKIMEVVTSSKDESVYLLSRTVDVSTFPSTTSAVTYSSITNILSSSEALTEAEHSSKQIEEMTSSTTPMTSPLLEQILTSSEALTEAEHSSKQIEEMTSSTTPMTSHILTSSEVEQSSKQIEGMTSTKPTKIMTSFQLMDTVTSSVTLQSTPVEYSSQQAEALTTPQPRTSSMSSSPHIIQAAISSQVNKETVLFLPDAVSTSVLATNISAMSPPQSLKSSTFTTEFSSVKNTTSYKGVKAMKTTLTFYSSPLADLMTSSHPAVTMTSTTGMKTTTTDAIFENSTSDSGTEHHPTHPTHPIHHEDTHTTHTHPDEPRAHTTHRPRDENVTHHSMGYPHEPEVNAATGDKKPNDADWEVSVFVMVGLLGGMLLFVIIMVIKDRARTGGANLRKKKRPVIGDDHGFMPLEELKVEEEPKVTQMEKRHSQRYSYYGNPEDAIPLLELHLRDGEPPLLNAHDDTEDTQPEEPAASQPKSRPLLDVYGDGSPPKEIVPENV